MNRIISTALMAFLVVGLLGPMNSAKANLNLSLIPSAAGTGPAGYARSYDIMATVSTEEPPLNLGAMEMVLDAFNPGDLYQNSLVPQTQNDARDTYITMPVPFNIFGAAVDILPGSSQTWTNQNLNIA